MKNIWSAHTLYLDWLHKCMRLCNPDLRSCFSLFWSISYFVFNHIRQPAGWFPGAFLRWRASPLDRRRRSACHHLPVLQGCLVSSLPEQGNLLPTEQLWKLVEFLECKELLQPVCACSLGSSCLTGWAFQQAGQSWYPSAPSSRKGCLLPDTGRRWCTWGKECSESQQEEFKSGFLMALLLSSSLIMNSSNMHFTKLPLLLLSEEVSCAERYEKLNTGKWHCCPTGFSPGSQQLKIKFSSSSSVSSAFN